MPSEKLSPLYQLTGDTIQEMISNLNRYFYSIFMDKQSRPLFNNKFIFFNMNKMYKGNNLPYPERFMHICSIEDKTNYSIFPCNNDISYSLCKNKCSFHKAIASFRTLGRTECPYRMTRIHWIPEIIQLYNNGSPYVSNWKKAAKNTKTNRQEITEYLRYNDGFNDYIVLLREDLNKEGNICKYTFITAYPVFLKRNKMDFENQFRKAGKASIHVT